MSERYTRLFSLANNLYTEGAPVLIAAGALLKDNRTQTVLAQLKFRNISEKALKAVKVRIHAFDVAGEPLRGVDSFTYLDLTAAPNEEFGKSTPIHLPDATTRSFSVEILSAVYADNEVYTPGVSAAAEAAPQAVLENVQRVEAEKQARQEAIRSRQAEVENRRNKQFRSILICAAISLAFVLLSAVLFAGAYGMPTNVMMKRFGMSFILALVTPCICLIAAFSGKKKPHALKIAGIACSAILLLQIAAIVLYAGISTAPGVLRGPKEVTRLASLLSRYVNGMELGMHLKNIFQMLGRAPAAVLVRQLRYVLPGLLAVLPNVLTSAVLLISARKCK